MSFSVLEQLRSAHEDLENIEKAMSSVLMDKHKNSRLAVSCDHALKYLVDTAQHKCKMAHDIYLDKDGMRTDDINALAGTRSDKKGDVWTSFYDKVKEVKDYHRRFSVNQGMPEVHHAHWFYERAFEADKTDKLFSGEEDFGKRVDMHSIYQNFINIKSITTQRKAHQRAQTFTRLKRRNPNLEKDDAIVDETVQKEVQELDYIQWLKEFDHFHEIPKYCKYRRPEYMDYVTSVTEYLRGFLHRTQPTVDIAKLEEQFDKEFEVRWAERSIPGWDKPTRMSDMYSLPTDRLFNNEGVLRSHQAGKQYKKRVLECKALDLEDQKKLAAESELADKRTACQESRAAKWHDLLSDVIAATVQHLMKKQSQTAEEMDMDRDDEDDDDEMFEDDGEDVSDMDKEPEAERPIYNPLNLPLGWDGKPIPFWLYKLHGLGIEYKCEICGNYSYWGRRAFERHFQEWRHAFGMRCLKIPNTAHFKEITKIEDAITLYEKLKRDAEEQTFRPDADVECEDIQGNVMSQKAFEDLRRQGLV